MRIEKLTLLCKAGDIDTSSLSTTFTHVTCCDGNSNKLELELDLDFSNHERKLTFEEDLKNIGYKLVSECCDVPFGEHYIAETTVAGNTKFLHLVSLSTGTYSILPVVNTPLEDYSTYMVDRDPNNVLSYIGNHPKAFITIHEEYVTGGGKFSESWLKRMLKSLEYCALVEFNKTSNGWVLCQTK